MPETTTDADGRKMVCECSCWACWKSGPHCGNPACWKQAAAPKAEEKDDGLFTHTADCDVWHFNGDQKMCDCGGAGRGRTTSAPTPRNEPKCDHVPCGACGCLVDDEGYCGCDDNRVPVCGDCVYARGADGIAKLVKQCADCVDEGEVLPTPPQTRTDRLTAAGVGEASLQFAAAAWRDLADACEVEHPDKAAEFRACADTVDGGAEGNVVAPCGTCGGSGEVDAHDEAQTVMGGDEQKTCSDCGGTGREGPTR